jgi:hypothetical protein
MERMAVWAVTIPADRWATERLFHHDTLTVPGSAAGVAVDDEVLLVAGGGVVALTQAVRADGDDLVLAYVRRAFDEPAPFESLGEAGPDNGPDTGPHDGPDTGPHDGPYDGPHDGPGVLPVDPAVFRRAAAALGAVRGDKRAWLVSVALPIEAATPAEAVRQFWSHVAELGPAELPTYVWPSGDELAMQAFVLGEEANQDPEEDED